jgi:hypothetical protein
LRLRSSRSSADSVVVVPRRVPSSVSAIFSQRCRHDSEIPKSFAICRNGVSPLRASATTSRRNSGGNGFGMANILPARNASSQVRSQPNRGQSQLVVGRVKSDDSERVIGLPEPCIAALRQHQVAQNAERKLKGKDWQETGFVFTTGIGTPIEPRNVNRHFVGLLEKAGLRRIRFHDLRHSCATLLYEQGVEIDKIQDILGHSSSTITKLIYVEVTKQSQRSTADKLGYLFDA